MKYFFLCAIIGVAFLFSGCPATVLPTPIEESPVFTVAGTLDGEPFSMEAGKDNFYLYTNFELGNDNIYTFSGALEKTNLCTTDCKESLKIEIRDHQETDNLYAYNQALTFPLGNYDFVPNVVASVDSTSYDATFSVNQPDPSFIYNWLIIGQSPQILTGTSITHTFEEEGLYLVCMNGFSGNNCHTQYCTTVFATPDSALTCDIDFSYNLTQQAGGTLAVQFTPTPPSGVAPFTYDWTYENSLYFSQDIAPIFPVDSLNYNPIEVCLTVTDAVGCSSVMCKTVDLLNVNQTCSSSFSYSLEQKTITNPADTNLFSNVIITYTDKNGKLYATNKGELTTNSTFEIVAVKEYEANENGQPTTQFDVRFTCMVYNDDGSSLVLENIEATFAVARPL